MVTIILIVLIASVVFVWLYVMLGFELARTTSISPKWRIWLTPMRNFKVNEEWDTKLNQLLDDNAPVEILNEYYAKIGDQQIWIANFPYASFTGRGSNARRLLTRKTAVRLTERLIQAGWEPT
jgi:hypothetical protein